MTASEVEAALKAAAQAETKERLERVRKLIQAMIARKHTSPPPPEERKVSAPVTLVRKKVTVEFKGDKIILPDGMSYDEAIEWLGRMKEAEIAPVTINEIFQCYPTEGAVAFARAIDELYGFSQPQTVRATRFTPEKPPVMLNVEIGPNEYTSVPWSRISVPKMYGYIEPGLARVDGRALFQISGATIKKFEDEFLRIIDKTRWFLKEQSIYKGRAITVTFPVIDKDFNPFLACPKYMDVSKVRRSSLIFSDDLTRDMDMHVFSALENPEGCALYGVSFKRGVLLVGAYGTGKTMTAGICAKLATDNNITFIHVKDVEQLAKALEFAESYQPAVIFAEDADKVMRKAETREEEIEVGKRVNSVANLIDGVRNKYGQIMLVLTTNHGDRIHPIFLRPGRFDATIHITAPDGAAIQRLLLEYGSDVIEEGADLTKAGQLLAGQIPAVVKEVIETARRAYVARTLRDKVEFDGMAKLKAVDIEAGARSWLRRQDFVKEMTSAPQSKSVVEKFANDLGAGMAQVMIEARTGKSDGEGTTTQ